jgi:hypothetical protein
MVQEKYQGEMSCDKRQGITIMMMMMMMMMIIITTFIT